jgi:uncharacterized OB-fold protein
VIDILAPHIMESDGEASPGDTVHLAAGSCTSCRRYEFPRRDSCPDCGAPCEPVRLSPEATVGAWTTVFSAPPGGATEPPYIVVVGRFPEGLSVLGLLDEPADAPLEKGDQLVTVALPIGEKLGFGFRRTGARVTPLSLGRRTLG